MKLSLHVLALSPTLPPRPAVSGHLPTSRSGSVRSTSWLRALSTGRRSPFAPPPAHDGAPQRDLPLYGAARVRRSDLLDRAERLRTLGW